MKELSTEEKAKAYDEALKVANKYKDTHIMFPSIKDEMFPELKESEDERMRAMAIKAVYSPEAQSCIKSWGINPDDVIAWLKKQGDKNPTNKVEPKFHEGDIITPKDGGHEPWQIMQVDILDKKYRFKDGYVVHFSQEDDYELVKQKPAWCEEDEDMFKRFVDLIPQCMTAHGYNELFNWLKSLKDRVQQQPKQEWSEEDGNHFKSILSTIKCCKAMFQNSPAVVEAYNADANWFTSIKDRVLPQPKQEWSEEDVEMINYVASILYSNFNENEKFDNNKPCVGALVDRLKSLKDRVQPQTKQEWSEEDERMYKAISIALSFKEAKGYLSSWYTTPEEADNWIKSLKDRVQLQPQWKHENIGDLTDFENAMMHIGESFFSKNAGLNPNDTNTIKEQANILSELVQSKEWSKEDSPYYDDICEILINLLHSQTADVNKDAIQKDLDWFTSLKDR